MIRVLQYHNRFLMMLFAFIWVCSYAHAQNNAGTGIYLQTDGRSYITGEQVWCSIRVTNEANIRLAEAGRIVFGALLDKSGMPIIQVRFSLEKGLAQGYIPLPSSLVSGIYMVAAVTGDPFLSAPPEPILVINPNKPPAPVKDGSAEMNTVIKNGTDNMVISAAKQQYGKREKISIDIDAAEAGASLLSMSIRRADTLELFADSLLSGLSIQPVLTIKPETTSWEGLRLRARVYPVNGTMPAPDVQVYVSVIGSEALIATTVSDAGGYVNFLLPLVFADAQLVFMPIHGGSSGYRIEFDPEPLEKSGEPGIPPLVLPGYLSGPIRTRVIESQVQNSFRPGEKTRLVIIDPDTTDFYGSPDKRYMLDDYTRFPNMEEIITEFVYEVRIRKNKEAVELQVVNAPYKKFFEEPALVMMDGVPVTDVRQLMELDPLKIKSIDIVSRKFFMGNHSFPGIIHYKSYLGNLGGYTLPVDAAVYSFEGVQLQKEYLSPDYSISSDGRIPDFRNLLFWAPSLMTDRQGKKRIEVYSGDLDGSYHISIHGISATGKQLNGSAKVDIK